MTDSPIAPDVLDRYLAGEATVADGAQIAAWMEKHPTAPAAMIALRSPPAGVALTEPERERLWEAAMTAIPVEKGGTVRHPIQRAGISLGIVMAAAMFAWIGYYKVQHCLVPESTRRETYATAAGQRATVTLQDGSRMTLGPATMVVVAQNVYAHATYVSLVGEALFVVTPDARRTFTVHTGVLDTRVLGTTFAVRHYATDRTTRVYVADGRVGLHNDVILSARMLGVADDSSPVRVTPNIAVEDYVAFVGGRLVFRDTPVWDVIADLNRAYGVQIQLADSSLGTHRVTLTVPTQTRPLADVLDILSVTLNVHITRAGSIITIAPGRTASSKSSLPFASEESRNGL